jgi:hypothetical protein
MPMPCGLVYRKVQKAHPRPPGPETAAKVPQSYWHRRLTFQFPALSANRHDSSLLFQRTHCVNAIHHYIQKYLLNFNAISQHAGEVFSYFGSNHYPAFDQLATSERQNIGYHILELQRNLFGDRLFC